MTLTGRPLVFALVGSALAGVAAGSFAEGWRKTRGLPVVASVDAGVSVQVDAGVSAKSDCGAVVDHWTTVYVPGPVRYLPAPDGGAPIPQQPQVVTVLVPDVRLTGSSASMANVQDAARAEASASVVVQPAAPERHWEAGPSLLYGGPSHAMWVGGAVGYSGGPFGVRLQVAADTRDVGNVLVGGSVVWRW